MKDCLIRYSEESRGYPTKSDWELQLELSNHPKVDHLRNLNYYTQVKDRLKNMTLKLRSTRDVESFYQYISLVKKL